MGTVTYKGVVYQRADLLAAILTDAAAHSACQSLSVQSHA